jgi:hypothetical protein
MAARLIEAGSLDAAETLTALKALDLQPSGPGTSVDRQILLARYAELDPETALTYVDTLPAGEQRAASLTIMNAWAAIDPAAAAAHLQENENGFGLNAESASQSAAGIAATWAASEPAAAVEWVLGLSGENRTAAVPALAGALAVQDPAKAAVFASALPESADRNAAVSAVALQWAQTSPAAAAAWLTGLTDFTAQASAASGLVTAWMQSDPASASRWINGLAAGSTRDAAIVALTKSSAIRNDAESAVVWASSIQDSALREDTLPGAVSRWRYQQTGVFGK